MDDKALNQLVSIKNLRPFRHRADDGEAQGQDEQGASLKEDRKHRRLKEKPVNIHRVINLKKQYKQQVSDRMDMVSKLEQNALEQEKSKLLKSGKDKKKHDKKADRILKKRKHKESNKERDESGRKSQKLALAEADMDDSYKKQKRMSYYGL